MPILACRLPVTDRWSTMSNVIERFCESNRGSKVFFSIVIISAIRHNACKGCACNLLIAWLGRVLWPYQVCRSVGVSDGGSPLNVEQRPLEREVLRTERTLVSVWCSHCFVILRAVISTTIKTKKGSRMTIINIAKEQ